MQKSYSSKIDSWLAAVVLGGALVAIGASVTLALAPVPGKLLIIVFTLLLAVGLPLWLFGSTCYHFTDTELIIQSGPFRWKVPIKAITAVTPTRNPLSSPALSLDRLRIDYGHGQSIMISPKDRDGFLAHLNELQTPLP